MMPFPDDPGTSRPDPPPLLHLSCRCQRVKDDPVTLCGAEMQYLADPGVACTCPAHLEPRELCVVCADLAERALILRRCDRCPR